MQALCADSGPESTASGQGIEKVEIGQCRSHNRHGKWRNWMIVDHRTYELQPGRLRDFLALYEKEGLPVQMKHLGRLVGYFTTEVGNVNEIVHIWAYED